MYPFHRDMDPYPQTFPLQRDHNPYPYHYHPIWEAIPPNIKIDPSNPPSGFGPWPYNGTFGHPNPTDHSVCCSHSYPPGYYSCRPLYSHIQPPPQPCYRGPYPPYPDAYPGFYAPPPHYWTDQARYDYDKAKDHCCGCPNHTCHRKDGSSLKIEEQKPESEQTGSDSSSLIRLPNYPYPFVSVSPSSMKEINKNFESHPGFWNWWVPPDVNRLNGTRQGEEMKNWHSEDKKMQFPWPGISMPGYDKPKIEDEAKEKEINVSPKTAVELPSKFKIIPLKLLENENHWEKPGVVEDEARNQVHPDQAVAEKERKTKIIPVKQIQETNEVKLGIPEKQKEKEEEKKSSIPVKQDSGVKKAADIKPWSPKKSSKLSPVCLRVDPLPRKKSVTPARKEERAHQNNKEKETTVKETNEEVPKVIRVVDIGDKSSKPVEIEDRKSKDGVPVNSLKSTSAQGVGEKASKVEDLKKTNDSLGDAASSESKAHDRTGEGKALVGKEESEIEKKEDVEASKSEEREEIKERRRSLSQPDAAAVVIQSAYRGFDVRRYQPLEKLRKISRIREQVEDVKRQIESLEAASTKQDMKQRVIVGETIMNLLLQLDTIQGLHPRVREIRKSLATELTSLQEKLDSLGTQAVRGQESSKVEDNPTEKTIGDDSAGAVSSSPVTGPAPGKEYVEVPEKVGETPDSTLEKSVEHPSMLNGYEESSAAPAKEENHSSPVTEPAPGKEYVEVPEKVGETPESTLEKSVEHPSMLNGYEESSAAPAKEENHSSEVGVTVVPHLVSEEPHRSEEAAKPSASSAGEEVPVVPHGDIASNLSVLEEPKPQEVNCQDLKAVEDDLSGASTGKDKEVDLQSGKPSEKSFEESSSEDGRKLEESVVVEKAEEEPELPKSDALAPLQNEEADTKQEDLHMLPPLLEEDGHVNKALGLLTVDNSSNSVSSPGDETLETAEGGNLERMLEEKSERSITNVENDPIPVEDRGVPDVGEEDGMRSRSTDEAAASEEIEGVDENVIPVSEIPLSSTTNESGSPASKEVGGAAVHFDYSAPEPAAVATINGADTRPPAHLEGSAPVSSVSTSELGNEGKKAVEENENLRGMLEQLLEAGKQQLGVIADLNGRVKDLERMLVRKKRVKVKRRSGASSTRQ